jgi:hypothetical protein
LIANHEIEERTYRGSPPGFRTSLLLSQELEEIYMVILVPASRILGILENWERR